MAQHSVPRGEKSSAGAANGSPGTPGYNGKHRAPETTASDVKTPQQLEGRGRVPRWLGGKG